MKVTGRQVYRFDQYILDVAEHRLKRGETEISLQPKAFETLVCLVERHGHLVKKNELLDAVWPDVAVSEGALTLRVKELRQALGDNAQRPRYIKTIPTVGYKFIGEVEEITETDQIPESGVGDIGGQPTLQNGAVASVRQSRRTSLRSRRIAFFTLTGAVVAVLPLVFAVYSFRPEVAVSSRPIKSLAVIPFKPLVANDRNEPLEMAMTDTLITKLNTLREVIVMPFSAVRKYTTLDQDAVAAGREQSVDAVVDGSIQRSGDEIRITVRLTTVEDGKQLWADEFNEKFTSVFDVQDLISERVAHALALELTRDDLTSLRKHYTKNSEAYDAYLWGRYFWAQDTEEGLTKAITYFHRALEKDPNYALAYTGLADSHILLGSYGVIPSAEAYRTARDATRQALTIDERLGEAHVSMGSILANYYWEWAEAEKHFKRAIELIPNDQASHNWYSQYLAGAGRFDEAIREAKLASEIAPTSRQGTHAMAFALYFAGRYEEAIKQSQKTLELDPKFPVAHALIGMAYLRTGNHEKAIAAFQSARRLFNSPGFLGLVGYAKAMSGKNNEARAVLEELEELSKKLHVPSFSKAIIYVGLGETKLAFEGLQRAVKERDVWLGSLAVDPIFEPLRSHPQFDDLLRQVGRS